MLNSLTLILLFLFAFPEKEKRVILVYHGCQEVEAAQDLALSVADIGDYLQAHQIKVKHRKGRGCGYELLAGKRKQVIKEVMTDLDLREEIKAFYQLPDRYQ